MALIPPLMAAVVEPPRIVPGVLHGGARDHLGVEGGVPRQQAQQRAEVRVRVLHHGRDAEALGGRPGRRAGGFTTCTRRMGRRRPLGTPAIASPR